MKVPGLDGKVRSQPLHYVPLGETANDIRANLRFGVSMS